MWQKSKKKKTDFLLTCIQLVQKMNTQNLSEGIILRFSCGKMGNKSEK